MSFLKSEKKHKIRIFEHCQHQRYCRHDTTSPRVVYVLNLLFTARCTSA